MFHEGQQLGEYTLIEKLGRGGLGEVWLAETDEDWFAVKLPHKDQVDWKAITQEIGLWTLCGKHPNVMPLIGARNFNGQIAIVSEYAPDGSLEDLLREKGKLSVEEAVEMTIGILEGLQHLHESGIIHRDLKPANILIDDETPRLTDFGISRIITADSLSKTVSGTWAYMAPECFDGKQNIQTDVWSVGVILYRMLAGNLPFPQKEQTSLIGSIIMREPEIILNDIPEELCEIAMTALSKDVSERYKTADEMRDFLDNFYFEYDVPSYNNPNQLSLFDFESSIYVSEYEDDVLQATHIAPILIPYRRGNKWGFSDIFGHILVEPIFDNAYRFCNGLSLIVSNGKRGYIDKTGRILIPAKYDLASNFSEDYALVKLDGKVGFIDKNGSPITAFKYDRAELFHNGLAPVMLNGKWGLINEFGDEVIDLKYSAIGGLSAGLIGVAIESKCGFIGLNDKLLISCKYDGLQDFKEGFAKVILNNKLGFINNRTFA